MLKNKLIIKSVYNDTVSDSYDDDLYKLVSVKSIYLKKDPVFVDTPSQPIGTGMSGNMLVVDPDETGMSWVPVNKPLAINDFSDKMKLLLKQPIVYFGDELWSCTYPNGFDQRYLMSILNVVDISKTPAETRLVFYGLEPVIQVMDTGDTQNPMINMTPVSEYMSVMTDNKLIVSEYDARVLDYVPFIILGGQIQKRMHELQKLIRATRESLVEVAL